MLGFYTFTSRLLLCASVSVCVFETDLGSFLFQLCRYVNLQMLYFEN